MPRLTETLQGDLEGLKPKHLYRDPEVFSSRKTRQRLDAFIDFSSNDYLGLSHHPRVLKKASAAAKKWGAGTGASRLLSGNLKVHTDLERKLASFKKEEAALTFSSGYLTNLGVVSTLVSEKDVVILDRLNHSSLVNGARLSRGKLWVYPHLDLRALEALLAKAGSFRRRLVVTDAYFSMDGHVAPMDELLNLCERYDAFLMVDEAHATGVFGRTGRGLTEFFGLSGRIPVVMGTLSKALGSVGGFVTGSRCLRETLVNFCPEFIFTTGPSPFASAAAMESLSVIEREPALRRKLWENTRLLRENLLEDGFDLMDSQGPIVPVAVGDTQKTLRIKESVKDEGFLISAIRPPTVPKGTDRLRLTVSAAHDPAQIRALALALRRGRDKRR